MWLYIQVALLETYNWVEVVLLYVLTFFYLANNFEAFSVKDICDTKFVVNDLVMQASFDRMSFLSFPYLYVTVYVPWLNEM